MKLDEWKPEWITTLRKIGNVRANVGVPKTPGRAKRTKGVEESSDLPQDWKRPCECQGCPHSKTIRTSLIVFYLFAFLLFWASLCLVVGAKMYFFGTLYKNSGEEMIGT